MHTKGVFVWDQSGTRIVGIMQVSIHLGAILIPEYLDSIPTILLPRAESLECILRIYSYSGLTPNESALNLNG